jgi:hypothetical protein
MLGYREIPLCFVNVAIETIRRVMVIRTAEPLNKSMVTIADI